MASVRTQLILWNVVILTVILTACGTLVRYRMEAGLLATVDAALLDKARPYVGPPDRHGPPSGVPPRNEAGLHAPLREGADDGRGQVTPDGGPDNNGGPNDNGPPGPTGEHDADQPGPPEDPENRGPGGRREPPGPPRRPRPDMRLLDKSGVDIITGNLAFDPDGFQRSLVGPPVYETIVQDGARMRVISHRIPAREGDTLAVVQFEQPLAQVDQELTDLNRALFTMIPIGLIAAALGAGFLAMRALRPVKQIDTAVGRIQAEDLAKRLPVAGQDEFAGLARTLNAMLGRIQQAFDEQRRFTMDASHELKTPLTVIKAKTGVALTRERTPESYQATLETIDRAADRMTGIVQDLLLLAQADSGQLGSRRRPVPLRTVVDTAMEGVFAEDGPTVHINLPDPSPVVQANPEELARVFRNLVENAVHHTPATGSVTIACAPSGNGLDIVVRDTGEGIPAEHLARICERFYRVDKARARDNGGSGLGLAICKSIVEAHGGRLTIESTPGAGTTVHVWLPA